ncbi:2-hydroxychromene-2-carboxylate isomerase [Vibrio ishigakensis]|uniref:2-hydroxychromene-2-carboxylate isomerase n=1 Tax=Vibrio ishigakensis TaxID=1481914 RepID=A0A0B8PIG5_9VIBR|nr:2-hydroxychromene-2-carboxylate isomerase [Vibrio ishigakensis]
MSEKLKLDFISDVVCPWCAIGYKRLEQAIKELGVGDKVEIELHPFELNPNMPAEGQNLRQHLAEKYGTTLEESIRARENLTQLGAEVDFTFDYYDDMKMYNTREAHLAVQFAAKFEKQLELKLALFDAFFGERKDVSDREVLAQLLAKVGLPVDEGIAYLDDINAISQLQNEESYWQGLGVRSVPTIVLNSREGLPGAQPVEVYKQVLEHYLSA